MSARKVPQDDHESDEVTPMVAEAVEIPLKPEERIEDSEPADNDSSDEEINEEVAEEINSLGGEIACARATLRPWMLRFCDELARFGVLVDAYRAAGTSETTVRTHKAANPNFALCYDFAMQLAVGRIERRGMKIAVEGTRRAIYHQGKIAGFEREYDTGMIQFMLKTRMPGTYADKVGIEITGAVAHLHLQPDQLAAAAANALPWIQEARAKHLKGPKPGEP